MPKEKLNILFVSAEVSPFAKVGGLADVAGSLPKALIGLGHDIRVIMPCYQKIEEKYHLKEEIKGVEIKLKNRTYISDIKSLLKDKIVTYFVDIPEFFRRSEVYMYEDDGERFVAFCKAVLESVKKLEWTPDVVHTNDWQTALIPALLKTVYKDDKFFKTTGTVYTIHNLAYQGTFPQEYMEISGIDRKEFTFEKLEFYGQMNLMKSGIVYADQVTTVSEEYAKEIQTEEYGEKLDGLLKYANHKLSGILNGIDIDEFNPVKDTRIFANFDVDSIGLKVKNKEGLLKELGLPVAKKKKAPLIGIISRLATQKGFDIIADVIDKIMQLDIQLVLLGTGDPHYHEMFQSVQKKYPKKAGINLKFDAALAQKIYAGSDMFLMPSRYEPCGLGQIISLRYGTIPIVRATGGLADTIEQFDSITKNGNGFVFKEYSGDELFKTLKKAIDVYQSDKDWKQLVTNAMKCDFSWNASAAKYVELYKKVYR